MGNRNVFYKKYTVNKTDFSNEADIKLPFQSNKIIISNDGPKGTLIFSFLKPEVDGELYCSDGPLTFDNIAETKIWFKKELGKPDMTVRVWAWRY